MNRVDKILLGYCLWAIPAVIVICVWGSVSDLDQLSHSAGMTRFFWDGLGWNFMIWLLASFYLVTKMVFSTKLRSAVLARIVGIKERDERESIVSGDAAKFSFLSTTAWMILFLFLSMLTVTVARSPKTEIQNDKRGFISIGMGASFLETEKKKEIEKPMEKVFVKYYDLPITKAGILLFLILWQIGSYRYMARRKL